MQFCKKIVAKKEETGNLTNFWRGSIPLGFFTMTASDGYMFFNDFKSASGPRYEFWNRLFRTGLLSDLFDDTESDTNSFPRMANFSNWMWIWRSVSDFCCRVFWFDFTDLTRFNFWHHFFYWALFSLRSSSPGFHCPSTFCLLLGTK